MCPSMGPNPEDGETKEEPLWVLQDFAWSPYDMVAKRATPEQRDSAPRDSAQRDSLANRGGEGGSTAEKPTGSTAVMSATNGENPSSSGSKTAEGRKATPTVGQLGPDQGHGTRPAIAQQTPIVADNATNGDDRATPGGNLGSRSSKLVCQVNGCGADLSRLKEYHQRYKICAHHLKVGYRGLVLGVQSCTVLSAQGAHRVPMDTCLSP